MTRTNDISVKHAAVDIGADVSFLTTKDKQILALLVEAAKVVDTIYLRQSNQDVSEQSLFRFDSSRPKNFYPAQVSSEDVTAYLDEYPDARDGLLNPFTVVDGEIGDFSAIPYAEYFKTEMEEVSLLLHEAAELCEEGPFKRFLELRSEAFLTNQYRESDIAWIHANNGPFEFTVGPYESYADSLFGVKRTFESILGVVLEDETAEAATFQEYVSQFDAMLGRRYGYKAKTTLTPMLVIDQVYSSGEALYDYVPMAYNLPNDRDIHEEVGSKKVFIRNVMSAKFELITRAIASKVCRFEEVERFDFKTYLRFVIGHESAHGLSFHFDGATFGPIASGIEEGKADVFGMWFLYYLVEQGVLEEHEADSAVIQNLTDGLRQIRFGAEEAHAVGTIIQLNWFIDQDALRVSEAGLDFDYRLLKEAVIGLAEHIYNLAHNESQTEVQGFVARWGTPSKNILDLLPRFEGIPVDINPIFSF